MVVVVVVVALPLENWSCLSLSLFLSGQTPSQIQSRATSRLEWSLAEFPPVKGTVRGQQVDSARVLYYREGISDSTFGTFRHHHHHRKQASLLLIPTLGIIPHYSNQQTINNPES